MMYNAIHYLEIILKVDLFILINFKAQLFSATNSFPFL